MLVAIRDAMTEEPHATHAALGDALAHYTSEESSAALGLVLDDGAGASPRELGLCLCFPASHCSQVSSTEECFEDLRLGGGTTEACSTLGATFVDLPSER